MSRLDGFRPGESVSSAMALTGVASGFGRRANREIAGTAAASAQRKPGPERPKGRYGVC